MKINNKAISYKLSAISHRLFSPFHSNQMFFIAFFIYYRWVLMYENCLSNSRSCFLSNTRFNPVAFTKAGAPASMLYGPICEKSLLTKLFDEMMVSEGITEPFEIVVLFPIQTLSPIWMGFVNGLALPILLNNSI